MIPTVQIGCFAQMHKLPGCITGHWLHNQASAYIANRLSECTTHESLLSSYAAGQVAQLLNYRFMLLEIAYIFKLDNFSAILLLLYDLFFHLIYCYLK